MMHARLAIKQGLTINNNVICCSADRMVNAAYLDAAKAFIFESMAMTVTPAAVAWRRPGLCIKVWAKPQAIHVDRGRGIKIKSEVIKYITVQDLLNKLETLKLESQPLAA